MINMKRFALMSVAMVFAVSGAFPVYGAEVHATKAVFLDEKAVIVEKDLKESPPIKKLFSKEESLKVAALEAQVPVDGKEVQKEEKKSEVVKERSLGKPVLAEELKIAAKDAKPTEIIEGYESHWRRLVLHYLQNIENSSLKRTHERAVRIGLKLDEMEKNKRDVALMRFDLNRANCLGTVETRR